MTKTLDQLIGAADHHAEDSGDFDYAIGDLQEMLRAAWEIMTVSQRLRFLRDERIESVVEAGAREEFDANQLIAEIEEEQSKKEAQIVASGYALLEGEDGFFWETETEQGFYFAAREDAVADGYAHLFETMAASPDPAA